MKRTAILFLQGQVGWPWEIGLCNKPNDHRRLEMNPQTRPDMEYLTSEHLKGLPFSEAVRVGTMLY